MLAQSHLLMKNKKINYKTMYMKSIQKLILLFFALFTLNVIYSQSYYFTIENQKIYGNTYEFDVYMYNTSDTNIGFTTFQMAFELNRDFRGSGNIGWTSGAGNPDYPSASSSQPHRVIATDLPNAYLDINVNIPKATQFNTQNDVIQINSQPGVSNNFNVLPNSRTLLMRLRIVNTQAFSTTAKPNIRYKFRYIERSGNFNTNYTVAVSSSDESIIFGYTGIPAPTLWYPQIGYSKPDAPRVDSFVYNRNLKAYFLPVTKANGYFTGNYDSSATISKYIVKLYDSATDNLVSTFTGISSPITITSGLSANKTYYFKVAAINIADTSDYSSKSPYYFNPINPYYVTVQNDDNAVNVSGNNGSYSPGDTATIVITRRTGYKINSIFVDGSNVNTLGGGSGISYNTNTGILKINYISNDHSIVVNSAPLRFKVTAPTPQNGTLTITNNGVTVNNGDSVQEGSNLVFTFTPSANYLFDYYSLNGAANVITPTTTLTVNVNNNVSFVVNFKIKTFNVIIQRLTGQATGSVTPLSQVINYGANAIFTVSPSLGSGYKIDSIIRFNGTNTTGIRLDNPVSGNLTVNNITDSTTIKVWFGVLPAAIPEIISISSTQNISVGDGFNLFVVATTSDPGTLYYQWYKKLLGSSSLVPIDGAITNTLTVNTTQKLDSGTKYVIIVTNRVTYPGGPGTQTSSTESEILLNVFKIPNKPTVSAITQEPGGTITENNALTLKSRGATTDYGTLSYRWQYQLKNTTNWVDVNNYLYTSDYKINNVEYRFDASKFRVIVYNTINNRYDSVISATFTLSVKSLASVIGTIVGATVGGIVGGGIGATIIGGGGYAIFGGGGAATAGAAATGSTAGLAPAAEVFSFFNPFAEVEASSAGVTLSTASIDATQAAAEALLVQVGGYFSAGSVLTTSVGLGLTSTATIAGISYSTLAAVVGGILGTTVVLAGVGGGIAAGVISSKDPGTGIDSPAIYLQPQSSYQKANSTIQFSVRASVTDGGTLSYQWQLNTGNNVWNNITTGTGSTDSNYTTPTLTSTYNGYKYRAVVTNTKSGKSVSRISNEATLNVTSTNKFIINTSVTGGGVITSSAEYNSGQNVTINFSPNSGFVVDKIYVDNILVVNNAVGRTNYTFNNLSASHVILVTFKAVTYIVTLNLINDLGTIQTSTLNVFANSTIRIPYMASTGFNYSYTELLPTGTTSATRYNDSSTGFTFTVNANLTINIHFTIQKLALTIQNNGNAVNVIQVPYNSKKVRATFASRRGYTIKYILVNGVRKDSLLGYTFDSVITANTINIIDSANKYTYRIVRFLDTSKVADSTITFTYGNLIREQTALADSQLSKKLFLNTVILNGKYYNDSTSYITFGDSAQNYVLVIQYSPKYINVIRNFDINSAMGSRIQYNRYTNVIYGTNYIIDLRSTVKLSLYKVTINNDTNNILRDSTEQYTLRNLTNNTIINYYYNSADSIYFISYNVRNDIGSSYSNLIPVVKGDTIRLPYRPTNAAFNLDSVIVSDNLGINYATDSTNGYTFKNINGNKSLNIVYRLRYYKVKTILISTLSNGTIQSTVDSLNVFATANFRITYQSKNGHGISSVFINNSANNLYGDSSEGYTFYNILGDSTLTVNTLQNSYNIISNSNIANTISQSSNVFSGNSFRVTFTFDKNKYQIDSVVVDSVGKLSNTDTLTGYTFNNVIRNRRINLYLSLRKIYITTVSDNGALIDNGLYVNYGADTTIQFSSYNGNIIDSIFIDSVSIRKTIIRPNINSLRILNVVSPITITLKTRPLYFAQVKADTGTIISINKFYDVVNNRYIIQDSIQNDSLFHYYRYPLGDSITFNYRPINNFKIDSLLENNITQNNILTSGGRYIKTNLLDNVSINIFSSSNLVNIITNINDTNRGRISPTTAIQFGSSFRIRYNKKPGYKLDSVIVNNRSVKDSIEGYTFRNVLADSMIKVVYKLDSFIVRVITGANGSITPNNDTIISINDTLFYTIKPNTGYYIDSVFTNNTYWVDYYDTNLSLLKIDTNTTIRVSFITRKPFTSYITASSGVGGLIAPNGIIPVSNGNTQHFYITSKRGYLLDSVFVNGKKVDSTTTYTFYNVRGDSTLFAKFKPDTFNVQTNFNYGGIVTINNRDTQSNNNIKRATIYDTIKYTFAPITGYKLDSVYLNNSKIDTINHNRLQLTGITNNDTVRVFFGKKKYRVYTNVVNGTVTPQNYGEVYFGDSLRVLYSPLSDPYILDSIFINRMYVGIDSTQSYTIKNIQTNDTITIKYRSLDISISSFSNSIVRSNSLVTINGNYLNQNGNIIWLKKGFDSVVLNGQNATKNSVQIMIPSNASNGLYIVKIINGPNVSNIGILRVYNDNNIVVTAFGDTSNGKLKVPQINSSVVKVAAGGNHSLALLYDGSLIGWGLNDSGQITIPQNIGQVVDIAAGASHSLALLSNGTVIGWGNNLNNQAQLNNNLNKNIIAISAGRIHSVGLLENGKPIVWGASVFHLNNIPDTINNLIQISSGEFHILGIRKDSTVVAWGDSTNNKNNVPNGLRNVIEVSAGGAQSLALKSDRNLAIWGSNYNGEGVLPNGLNEVVRISSGQLHNITLKRDSTIVAWGDNTYKQTQLPSYLNKNRIIGIRAGGNHNLVMLPVKIFTQSTSGGVIDSSKLTTIGANDTIRFSSNTNYIIDSIIVNGNKIENNNINQYVFNNISGLQFIRIVFKSNVVKIDTNIIGKGTLTSIANNFRNITKGSNVRISYQAATGYYLKSVRVNGRLILDSTTGYTFKNLQADSSIQVEFAKNMYLIQLQAANIGGISIDTTLYYGDSINLQFGVLEGYKIDSVDDDGVNLGEVYNYIIPFLNTNHNFVIHTSRKSYLIRTITTKGGTITNNTRVFYGDSIFINIIEKKGYKLDSILLQGVKLAQTNSFWLKNVKSDTTVSAFYSPINYPVYITQNGNGNVFVNKTIINIEDTLKITSRAIGNGYIDTILVNNEQFNADSVLYLSNLSDTQRIFVKFSNRPNGNYLIKASKNNGGTIYPFGNVTYSPGSTPTYNIIPNAGYTIDSLIINGRPVTVTSNYTFNSIMGDSSIRVVFKYLARVKLLRLKVFIQGYMAGTFMRPSLRLANLSDNCDNCIQDPNYVDTLTIELRNLNNNTILSSKSLLKVDGNVEFNLGSNLDNGSYYILVKHRSTIETWSAVLVSFSDSIINYDFSSNANSAYGSNLKRISSNLYAIFSGHVHNTDQTIDVDDYNYIRTDFKAYLSGYLSTDINGNGFVDTDDLLIFKYNFINYVSSISPFDEE